MRCACAISSSVACQAVQYYSSLSHKRYDFRKKKKVIELKLCVLVLSIILPETFLILRRSERDMIGNVYRSLCNIPVILFRF